MKKTNYVNPGYNSMNNFSFKEKNVQDFGLRLISN